ncbi:T9SS type A sorting domain-containing protein [Aureivirga sp. CE67]|uniref:T9SS type A sorting domain-containing protein n=1 Tax=Aureivirga sp. CE67 TaxID=1788983 RepID=UPI0018C930E5|nr:T9SS type A sorting domain-containing protein [Aureivirga sp. CE67]
MSSQAEINSFSTNYAECTELSGNLTISGEDITTLEPLQNITSIGGNLFISNTSITVLDELSNLETVSGFLKITNNAQLTEISLNSENLNDLFIRLNPNLEKINATGLESANEIDIYGNASLNTLNLFDLSTVYNLLIGNNDNLESLTFLSLENSTNNIQIYQNDELNAVNFPSLTTADDFTVHKNDSLILLNISSLETVEDFDFISNESMLSLDLNSITSTYILTIEENLNLVEIKTQNLNSIHRTVIENNNELKNITFNNVTEIGPIKVEGNLNLEKIEFGNLAEITGDYPGYIPLDLHIKDNNKLEDILFSNLNSVESIRIEENPSLTNCTIDCSIFEALNTNTIEDDLYFQNNSSFLNDISDLCPQIGIEEENIENLIILFPNPVKDYISIQSKNDISKIQVLEITGKQVLEKLKSKSIKIENLKNGIYIIKVFDTNNNILTDKFIKG